MITTVDISMYPFNKEFKAPILGFIENIKKHKNIKVVPSSTSTIVQGQFVDVMQSIQETISQCHDEFEMAAYVLKIIPGYEALE